ncbi:MAG: helix-turn-helix transcriptional regulator [Syntrophobacteria bacterium]
MSKTVKENRLFFSKYLSTVRKMHGLTQEELAKGIGFTGTMVSHIEHNRRLPSVKFCAAMGRKFNDKHIWMGLGAAAHGWEL